VAFPFVMFWVYRWRLSRWNRQAPQRMAAAPPPGAAVRLDAAGLTVGDAFVAWGDLVVERVDLASMAGRQSAGYFLRRVAVRGPNLACALDVALMRNGQAIVNEVYRRLCRPALRRR
jgi:hypothetical protein